MPLPPRPHDRRGHSPTRGRGAGNRFLPVPKKWAKLRGVVRDKRLHTCPAEKGGLVTLLGQSGGGDPDPKAGCAPRAAMLRDVAPPDGRGERAPRARGRRPAGPGPGRATWRSAGSAGPATPLPPQPPSGYQLLQMP